MSTPEPRPTASSQLEAVPATLPTAGDVAPGTRIVQELTTSDGVPVRDNVERYEVLRLHAKGGMGQVLVALDRQLGREVAFKEIQPQFSDNPNSVKRFLLEAEVTGRLEHPGIVPIYGLGMHPDGRPFYAMRFIHGDSLGAAIHIFHEADQKGGSQGERELGLRGLLRRFVDVCNAVAFAHHRGWLHRDIKPANIMLGQYGETLLVDWGLAKYAGQPTPESETAPTPPEPRSEAGQTRPGMAVGTPAYMSPEQARGLWEQVGLTADIYSLGATLYELLTGRVPRDGSVVEMLQQARDGDFVWPRRVNGQVPAALETVVVKAMARRPEDRYATAQELAAEVERWLADEPVRAHREPWMQRGRRWLRRHRTLASVGLALVLTATVTLALGLWLVNQEKNRTAEAKLETERALDTSRQAEQMASAQRKLALATIRRVVDDIHGQLKGTPAMLDLRQRLLEGAFKGLTEVARSAETALAADHQQIWLHFELGELFRLCQKQGAQQAREQYERAHSLARQMVEADPGDPQAQRVFYVSLQRLGDIQLVLGEAGTALKLLQEFHSLCKQRLNADPNNAQVQHDMSVALNRLGDVQQILGDSRKALDCYQQALDIEQGHAKEDPTNPKKQSGLAIALDKIGEIRLELGETQAALEYYQQALAIRRQLSQRYPDNTIVQRELAASLNHLGRIQSRLGNARAALDYLAESLQLFKRRVQADPMNAEAQRDLAVGLIYLGDMQHKKHGDSQAAFDSYRQSLDILESLAQANPRSAQAQRDVAGSISRLGDVHLALGETRAALDRYEQELAIMKQLAEAFPDNGLAQADLAIGLNSIADALLKHGDLKAALDAGEESLRIRKSLAQIDPKNSERQDALSCSLHSLGDIQQVRGDTKAALEYYQQSLDIRQRRARNDPKNAEAQLAVATSLCNVGDVLLKQGDRQAALKAHEGAFGHRRRWAADDPNNAGTRREMLVSCFKLGTVRESLDDFAGAALVYGQGLEIARRSETRELVKDDIRKLEKNVHLCRAVEQSLLDPISVKEPSLRLQALTLAGKVWVRKKVLAKALGAADILAKEATAPDHFYEAARIGSACSALAEKPEEREQLQRRAVALLRLAIDRGFNNLAHIKKDTDLDAIRKREDFRQQLQRLEVK